MNADTEMCRRIAEHEKTELESLAGSGIKGDLGREISESEALAVFADALCIRNSIVILLRQLIDGSRLDKTMSVMEDTSIRW